MQKVSPEWRVGRGLRFFARYWVGTILLIYAAPKIMSTQYWGL